MAATHPTGHPSCPDRSTLVAFAEGHLNDPAVERVAGHVETCARCGATLRDLLRDPASPIGAGLLRECADPAPAADPAYGRMEATARALCGKDTVTDGGPGGPGSGARGLGAIGPYALIEVLGRGGMGIVYRASHRVLRRTVALKTLLPGRHAGPDALARFWVEAEAIARLDHPNVVAVEHFDEAPEGPYLAMELVEGETLTRKLSRGPLPAREAAELVRVLAAAVGYAHGRGVVHRDLKPSNVLIARDGTPKVTDFGLAMILGDDRARLTRSDAVLGTPAYMAPEQAAGRQAEVGPPADVYALGAILYHALAGVSPLASGSSSLVLGLVRREAIPPPSRHRPGVPRDLEAICLKCLEPSPNDRYPTAEALEQELGRWLNGRPTHARLPGRVRTLVRRVRWGPVAAGLVLAAGLVGATAAIIPRPGPAVPDGESEVVRRELEAELDAGRAVTLVGEVGWPKWFRWRAGRGAQRTHIEPDGTFSAEMLDQNTTGLVELLPDSRTDRYKLTAQVRQDLGGYDGFVGLYVAHQAHPREPRELQLFGQVRFNAVTPTPRVIDPSQPKERMPEGHTQQMGLALRLHTDRTDTANVDQVLADQPGPRMAALAPRNGVWHDLEVVVTPDGITAAVGGDRMTLPAALLGGEVLHRSAAAARKHHPDDRAVQNFRPEFAPRGGLGLVLNPRSAASVRRVTVTPLPVGP